MLCGYGNTYQKSNLELTQLGCTELCTVAVLFAGFRGGDPADSTRVEEMLLFWKQTYERTEDLSSQSQEEGMARGYTAELSHRAREHWCCLPK